MLCIIANPASTRPRSQSMPIDPVADSPFKSSPGTAAENRDTDAPWPQLVHCGPAWLPSTARNDGPSSSSRPVIERPGAEAGSFQPPIPWRANGSSSAAGACSAPSARASPAMASASAWLSPAPERPSRCPASVMCEPASRGVSRRVVTISTASEAAVRASHACWSGSEFRMRPTFSTCRCGRWAPFGFDSTSRKYSAPSSMLSSSTATLTVLRRSPAVNTSVPEVAV